jgi:hypothetical protein
MSYVGNASTIQLPVKCFEDNSASTVVAPAAFTPYLTVTFTPTITGFALASYTLQSLASSGTAYMETQIYQDAAPVGNVVQTPMTSSGRYWGLSGQKRVAITAGVETTVTVNFRYTGTVGSSIVNGTLNVVSNLS